jgi:hypothetical protein
LKYFKAVLEKFFNQLSNTNFIYCFNKLKINVIKLVRMKIKYIKNVILYTFFLFYFLVGLLTYDDYGIGIEEHTQLYSGAYWLNYIFNYLKISLLKEDVLKYLQSFFNDIDQLPDPKFYTYGPIFDVPTALIDIIINNQRTIKSYEYRHFLVFFIFYVTSIFVYKILAKRFNNFFLSLFGTVLYIFSPRIYGDSFHNNKDIIFFSFVVFSIYYSFKIFKKKKIKNILLFSIFASIATSTRIIGLFLPFSLILFLYLEKINYRLQSNIKYILMIIFSYLLFLYIHWPYLWEKPISSFIDFIQKSKIWIWKFGFLFNGEYIFSTSIPDSFIFIWIGISTPILNLILFLFGFFYIGKRLFNRLISIDQSKSNNCDFWRNTNEMKDYYIFFNLIAIISLLIFLSAPLANAWRHLYFLNFFIIYISSYFIMILYLAFKKYVHILVLTLSFLLIPNIYKIIIFHPYQSLYLNEILSSKKKNDFQIDREGLTRLDSIYKILSFEPNKEKIINIANASYLPYYRILDALDLKLQKRINFVGQEYNKADYIFDNYVYEVDPRYNDKYNVPSNFINIYELEIDGIRIYRIYKKK